MPQVSAGLTVTARVAVPLLLPWLVCRAPAAMVLVLLPVVMLARGSTGTVMVQLPDAGMRPAVMVMEVPPGVADRLLPTQVLLAAGVLATTNLPVPSMVVKLSVKLVMVAAVGLLVFCRVMVNVVACPWTTVADETALLMVGNRAVRLAVAVAVLLPWSVFSAAAATVLT